MTERNTESLDSDGSSVFTEWEEILKNQTRGLGELSPEEKQKTLALDAVLTSVEVIYWGRDNDKDGDTRLESWINMAGDREAAYHSTYGHWDDWSTHVVTLTPKSNVMRKSNIAGSWLQIRISPNGNDTWSFTCRCTLYFSDGTAYQKNFGDPTTLDQGSRQTNKYL